VNQTDRSAATITSLGELSGAPSNASTSVSPGPPRRTMRRIRAGVSMAPCSQTTSRPSRSIAMPLARFASGKGVVSADGATGKRAPSSAIRRIAEGGRLVT
jgi:hypothetical protein